LIPGQTRNDTDALGIVKVPAERLFGPQTARAFDNFPTSDPSLRLGAFPVLIRCLIQIKQAAAEANLDCGYLTSREARLIISACRALLGWSDFTQDFPIHILHGGGGTSANMNTNEVIANLANSKMRRALGSYTPIHPLDHVNRNQSTNDVYPSACRLAIALASENLIRSLSDCSQKLRTLQNKFARNPRLVRTCLQDAVSSDFSRFFAAQRRVLDRYSRRIVKSARALCEINLGGGVAGEPNSSPIQFRRSVLTRLRNILPELLIRTSTHFADAAQNSDDLLEFAQSLDGLARTLIKQCSDLRILSSGPECGFREIVLPAVQPGSSVMPGKINPVIPEFVIQSSFTVIGFMHTCGLALEHADLDLNVWEGTFVHSILSSISLLSNAVSSLSMRCLSGLIVNESVNREHSISKTALVTNYARKYSYSEALKSLQDPQSNS
jgi:aspartate ammonia-lyase